MFMFIFIFIPMAMFIFMFCWFISLLISLLAAAPEMELPLLTVDKLDRFRA